MFSNKIRYLFLVAFAGLISILYNQYVMGIVFITILMLPLLLFALLCISYGMVRAELRSVVHVVRKGEVVPITIQLYNPMILPIYGLKLYLTYQNKFSSKLHKKEVMVTIDGRSNLSVTCNLQSEYAGNLEVSLSGIRCYDYLKLFSLKKKWKDTMKVAVLPSFYEIEEEFVSNRGKQYVESEYYSQTKSGDDPSEVFSIREYREGDRLQRIHWKLSSKQDQLMIKEFSEPLNCSVLIYLDFDISNGKDIIAFKDALLECAMSVSYSLLLKKQYHYFSWYDGNLGVCRRHRVVTEKDLYEVVDGILEGSSCLNHSNTLATYLAQHPTEQYTDLLYITEDLSEAKLDSLSMLLATERRVIFIRDQREEVADKRRSYEEDAKATEYWREITELGIGLSMINISNLQYDIQNLNLS